MYFGPLAPLALLYGYFRDHNSIMTGKRQVVKLRNYQHSSKSTPLFSTTSTGTLKNTYILNAERIFSPFSPIGELYRRKWKNCFGISPKILKLPKLPLRWVVVERHRITIVFLALSPKVAVVLSGLYRNFQYRPTCTYV